MSNLPQSIKHNVLPLTRDFNPIVVALPEPLAIQLEVSDRAVLKFHCAREGSLSTDLVVEHSDLFRRTSDILCKIEMMDSKIQKIPLHRRIGAAAEGAEELRQLTKGLLRHDLFGTG